MAIKYLVPLVTIPGFNEQTGASQTTQTATGVSKAYGIASRFSKVQLMLDVSAVSGTTPSLVVSLEGIDPVSLKWQTFVTFPAQTAVTPATPLTPIIVDPLYWDSIRTRWTITGTTPSFTFSLAGIFLADEPISK